MVVPSFRVAVTAEGLNPAVWLDEVSRDASGATVLFVGTVRDHSEGRDGVTHLVYEAYIEHVEQRITEIFEEAAKAWPLLAVAIEHRVAVATAHREDAFEAGRFLIDELKARAPIWKQENWADGREWIEGA